MSMSPVSLILNFSMLALLADDQVQSKLAGGPGLLIEQDQCLLLMPLSLAAGGVTVVVASSISIPVTMIPIVATCQAWFATAGWY